MKNTLRGRSAFILAFGLGLFGVSSAFAQVQGVNGQPVQPPDRPDLRSPNAIAAENYDPKGLPVGSFRLFPELELDEVYNDNIYATTYGTSGRTSSFVQLIKPSLNLRSDWNQNMLNFFAKGNFGLYSAAPLSNFTDYSFGTDGRYDVGGGGSNAYAGASFNHNHEDPGTPNAAIGAFPPNLYDQITGNIGYLQRFNRLNVRVDGRIDNYNYLNPGSGPSTGSAISNYQRDRTEFREALRVGYEFIPNYQVWVRGSLNQRDYQNTPDGNGFYRNSSGFDVVAGISIDLGGITSLEAYGGYLQQNYVDGRFGTIAAPTFGLTGYWNPIRELMVKPFVRRTVEEANLTTASSYTSTAGGVDVDYKMRPNLTLNAHGDYSVANYNVIAGSNSEYDQYLTLRASAQYLFTQNFYVGPFYQYVNKVSNLANANYDQNVFMVKLGARF